MTRYGLGAEELIELGRPLPLRMAARKPYFANRPARLASRELGQLEMLGSIAGFLTDGISFALTQLGNLLDVPLKILSQGVDLVFNGVADLLRNIPIIGDLLAEVLVLGGSIIKFALSVPGFLLRETGNIFAGISKALKGENSNSENQQKVDEAKDRLTSKAPAEIKDTVKGILDASGITGSNLTPGVSSSGQVSQAAPGTVPQAAAPGTGDLGTALAIGIPVIGVVALVVALT